MEFKLNFSPSPDDERDFIFSSEKEYPEELDYSDELQPIRNQGSQGSCYAQSACCMKEWQEKRDYGLDEYLSPQFFYNNRYNIYDDNENNDYGMYGRDVMRLLRSIGVCLERNYKYGLIEDKSKISKKCYEEALNHRIKSYARVYDMDQLKKSLFRNGPCLIGFPVYNKGVQMWQKKEGETNTYGGHAMTVIGYNKEGFIIRNSWGEYWGSSGYCIYPYEDWGSHWEIWTTVDDESEIIKPNTDEVEESDEEPIPPPPTPDPVPQPPPVPEYEAEIDEVVSDEYTDGDVEGYESDTEEETHLRRIECPFCVIL